MVTYEKSCGAVVYRMQGEQIEYLLVLNKKGNVKGHWGFPKGHVEAGETELQTAEREIFEETGLRVAFLDGFRSICTYSPRHGVKKDAVYFLGCADDTSVSIQLSEIAGFRWLAYEQALETLSFDKQILVQAHDYLCENQK